MISCSAFAGLVYGGSTCILDNYRGKDGTKQLMNSVLGGCIAGLVVGARCMYFANN